MDTIRIIKDITDLGCSLVVIKNNNILYKSDEHGVRSLFDLLKNSRDMLNNATVFDKIIGKAAALLLVLGKVKEVYALTLSKSGRDVLDKYDILYKAENIVDTILGFDKSSCCPFEEMSKNKNPNDFYNILLHKYTNR